MAREKKVLAIYVDDICPAACNSHGNSLNHGMQVNQRQILKWD